MGILDQAWDWARSEQGRGTIGGLGVGLSQLAAGQPANIMPYMDAARQRMQGNQFRDQLPELAANMTPQQQAFLMSLPPNVAQQIIAETMFAAPAAGPEPTADIQNYQFYAQQEAGAGREPLPYQEWRISGSRAGATVINNNTGSTGIDYGKPEDGFVWAHNEDGTVATEVDAATGYHRPIQVPIAGGAVEAEAAAAADQEAGRDSSRDTAANVVLDDIDRALTLTDQFGTTGTVGWLTSSIPGTNASNLHSLTETVKANISMDKLQEMRMNSPTGGALGNVSDSEGARLAAILGDLSNSQGQEQLQYNLRRLRSIYLDTIHGAGNYDPETGQPNATQAAPADMPPGFTGGAELWQFLSPEDRALWAN